MRKTIVLNFGLLFVTTIIFCLISCKREVTPQLLPKEDQAITERTDQLISDVKDLKKIPEKNKEYWEIIKKFTAVIGNEVKEDPEAMESSLRDIFNLISKSGPGSALWVEDFANTAVKEEMAKLREESGVIQLKEKDNQILDLQEENTQLKQETAKVQKITKDRDDLITSKSDLREQLSKVQEDGTGLQRENEQLRQTIAELREVQKNRDELLTQITQLQTRLDQVKRYGAGKR